MSKHAAQRRALPGNNLQKRTPLECTPQKRVAPERTLPERILPGRTSQKRTLLERATVALFALLLLAGWTISAGSCTTAGSGAASTASTTAGSGSGAGATVGAAPLPVLESHINTAATAQVQSKDEVIYGLLNADGTLSQAVAVNHFKLASEGSFVDYGSYNKISNLSNVEPLTLASGEVGLASAKGDFYYQGTISAPRLPWQISLAYTFNGRSVAANTLSELGGENGRLGITIATTPAPDVDASFWKNYALQISLTLPSNQISALEAPDATIVSAGSNTQLTWTVLPESRANYQLAVSFDAFECSGITVAAVPFGMNFELPDTSGITGELSQLEGAVAYLAGGTAELAGGLELVANGSQQFNSGIKALSGVSAGLNGALAQLNQGIASALDGLGQLNSGFSQLNNSMAQLGGALGAAGSGMAQLNSSLGALVASLQGYQASISASDPATAAALSAYLAQLQQLEQGYAQTQQAYAQTAQGYEQLAQGYGALAQNYASATAGLSGALQGYLALAEGLAQYTGVLDALAAEYRRLNTGLAPLATGASELAAGVGTLHEGVQTMPEEMQSRISEFTAAYDFSGFEPHSFLSAKNTQVSHVQFVLTTPAIKPPAPASQPDDAPQATSLFDKLLALFG